VGIQVQQQEGSQGTADPAAAGDAVLLRRYVAEGDRVALSTLFDRHTNAAFRLTQRFFRNTADAEDAVQTAFVQVLARASGFAGDDRTVRTWILGLVMTACRNKLREEKRRTQREIHAVAANKRKEHADLAEEREQWQTVANALQELPENYRLPLVLHYGEGLTSVEVAAVLHVAEGTVRSQLTRGLERLRTALASSDAALSAVALAQVLAAEAAATAAPATLKATLARLAAGASPAGHAGTQAFERTADPGARIGGLIVKIGVGVLCGTALVGIAFWAGAGRAADKPEAKPSVDAPAAEKGRAPAVPQVPLNPQIAAMGDNTWLKLPTPATHPVARSGSPYMPYAPEAGVGLLWGCGANDYRNDLWTYNLALNEWKELLKTEPDHRQDPDVYKFKDGVLMTREERPVPSHQWGRMDYDPDRKILWHLGGGMLSTLPPTKQDYDHLKREGDPDKIKGKGPALWKYEFKTNKWSMIITEDPTGCTREQSIGFWRMRYYPPLRKLIMEPGMVTPNEAREKFKAYDPDTNRWEPLLCQWKPLEDNVSKDWIWGMAPAVYDTKRQALVLILGAGGNTLEQQVKTIGGTWLLDGGKKTCEQVAPSIKTPIANLDGPEGGFVYDSASGTTLCLYVSYYFYEVGKVMAAKGFPIDRPNVWALDVEKKDWILQPKPANGVLPPMDLGCFHHFYDPVQNVTVVYMGKYNSSETETWVYRYKRAAK